MAIPRVDTARYRAEGGMSEQDALVTATRDAAGVIGFDDTGTLEPGKRADLVVLRENPLERIRALTEPDVVEVVLLAGEVAAGRLPEPVAVSA